MIYNACALGSYELRWEVALPDWRSDLLSMIEVSELSRFALLDWSFGEAPLVGNNKTLAGCNEGKLLLPAIKMQIARAEVILWKSVPLDFPSRPHREA